MLSSHQFPHFNDPSPYSAHLAAFNSSPYKYPPAVKSREELDLMEAKARALNLKVTKQLYGPKSPN